MSGERIRHRAMVWSAAALLAGFVASCGRGGTPVVMVRADMPPFASTTTLVEGFETPAGWNVIKPAETSLDLLPARGVNGESRALALNFDLGPKKLYVVISKKIPLSLPANFKLSFHVKGPAPANNLELKLIDAKGNVFRKTWENYAFSEQWSRLEVSKAELPYAWGPDTTATLGKIETVEFALSCGSGGAGRVTLDELALTALEPIPDQEPLLKNGSFERGFTDWEKSGTARFIECFPFQVHHGGKSAGIGNDNGPDNAGAVIAQAQALSKPTVGGEMYIFSMWLQSEDKYTGRASLKIDYLDANRKSLRTFQSEVLTGKFAWRKLSVRGEAPAGARFITVQCVSEGMKPAEGSSFVWFDNGDMVNPLVTASTTRDSADAPVNVLKNGSWHSESGRGSSPQQWLNLDFGRIQKFAGIELGWGDDYATEYEVLGSTDGARWRSLVRATKDTPGPDEIFLDVTYARHVRINCLKGRGDRGFGIKTVSVMEPSRRLDLKSYFILMAREHPGQFSRWMRDEQAYWATVGAFGDTQEATLGEDGTLEPFKRGFTLMPLIGLGGKLLSRDDVKLSQSLAETYLPIPSVRWEHEQVTLDVQLFACGATGKTVAYALYKVTNPGKARLTGNLYLALRPFQNYPPWQGNTDGFAPLGKVSYADGAVIVNDKHRLVPLFAPVGFGALAGSLCFAFPVKVPAPPDLPGDITYHLRQGKLPAADSALDPAGFASGALACAFDLAAGESREFILAIPLYDQAEGIPSAADEKAARDAVHQKLADEIAFWSKKINTFDIDIPEMDLIHITKANTGWNLVNMDGPWLQPGSRSYDKSWWRDGSIQASSLYKMGLVEEPRAFVDEMITYQYASGELPPIIDNKAADPLWEERPPINIKEYDAQGEMIWAVLEDYYFTHDRTRLERYWDNVHRNLKFLAALRRQRMTREYAVDDPDTRRFYGILPQSRSHEGYWFNHSYWDDWWAIKGWHDGLAIARILGKPPATIRWIEREYDDFVVALANSIKATAKFKNVDYISGCAELGDYDPTSVAVAINYGGELTNVRKLLQPHLDNTFNRYYADHEKRVKPGASFHYTPYEARNAPVFIYMGQKDRALSLIRFLVSCSRPYPWMQLAEVVNSTYRNPNYIGDMPHTWVGAELMNSVRGLFAYEQDDLLFLGAGVDEKWLDRPQGIAVKNLPTYYGRVRYTMKKDGGDVVVELTSPGVKPPQGVLLHSPRPGLKSATGEDGKPLEIVGGQLVKMTACSGKVRLSY